MLLGGREYGQTLEMPEPTFGENIKINLARLVYEGIVHKFIWFRPYISDRFLWIW
jgi:hypothetical protein